MNRTTLILLAGGGSALLLLGAFGFQHLGGMAPCKMCLWQRWPHAAAILIAVLAVMLPGRVLPLLGMGAALATAGIGLYHSGVERKWWEGPASCTGSGPSLTELDGAALLPGGGDVPALVLCDSFEPFFLGLTMANWNAVMALGLAALWLRAALR